MMGGGVCWLDYDGDGWLDLYVVNAYAETDIPGWEARGGLPTSRLFRNVGGRFEDVTAATGADLAVRGSGCVAADLDGERHDRPLRHDRRLRRRARRLRRAALERRRRDVHRGRLGRRASTRFGLAHRRGRGAT